MELSERALNRALMARQLLVERVTMSVEAAVEHLVAMQGQVPAAPYYGLWTRLADFRPEVVGALIENRVLVRMSLLRGTIHLVSARDCVELRPLLQPMFDRWMWAMTGPGLDPADVKGIADLARELVEARPRTFAELTPLLAQRWPDHSRSVLSAVLRSTLTLAQVPPRGVWGASGPAAHTTIERWLGAPLPEPTSMDAFVLRYLAAFGPASVRDVQTWCGLARLGEVIKRLKPKLVTVRGPDGALLYDLPDAPRPSPDLPVPVRFLPEYDNCLRSHADRTRVIPAAVKPRLISKNDSPRPTVLIDGFVAAGWRLEPRRGALTVTPYRELSDAEASVVIEEGRALLAFAAPGVPHDVELAA